MASRQGKVVQRRSSSYGREDYDGSDGDNEGQGGQGALSAEFEQETQHRPNKRTIESVRRKQAKKKRSSSHSSHRSNESSSEGLSSSDEDSRTPLGNSQQTNMGTTRKSSKKKRSEEREVAKQRKKQKQDATDSCEEAEIEEYDAHRQKVVANLKSQGTPDSKQLAMEMYTAMRTKVWRTKKFCSNENENLSLTETLFDALDPSITEGFDKETWCNEPAIQALALKHLNQARAYVLGQLTDALRKFYNNNGNALPSVEDIVKCAERKIGNNQQMQILFEWYWEEYLPMCTGNTWDWDFDTAHFELISEAHYQESAAKFRMSVSNEAFAVLAFENIRDKCLNTWKEEATLRKTIKTRKHLPELPWPVNIHYTTDKKFKGKWSSSSSGQQRYGGWHNEGLERFKTLKTLVKNARATDRSKSLEKRTLTNIKKKWQLPEEMNYNQWLDSKNAGKKRGKKNQVAKVCTMDDDEE